MSDSPARDRIVTTVQSLMSKLEGDRAKKIDPVETWESIKSDVDVFKAEILASKDLKYADVMLVNLIGDLLGSCEDLHAEVVASRKEPATDPLQPSHSPLADWEPTDEPES
jgi:hypothetical protein